MKYTLQVELFPGTTSHQLGELLKEEARDWMRLHPDEDIPLVSQERFIPLETGFARGYWSLEG